jgi:hypothetical protein
MVGYQLRGEECHVICRRVHNEIRMGDGMLCLLKVWEIYDKLKTICLLI